MEKRHHQNTATFLDLPEEVVESGILPYLQWNDLLRLRRVCQTTKCIIESFTWIHPESTPQIEINEDSQNVDAFLKMGIATTKIYLNNVSGDEFYGKDEDNMILFRKKLGPLIKSLRVRQLSLYVFGKELDFMEALVNLQSLEIDHIGYWSELDLDQGLHRKLACAEQDARISLENPAIFNLFKNLKTLKIGQERYICQPVKHQIDRFGQKFMTSDSGKKLEFVRLPFTASSEPNDWEARHNRNTLSRAINFVKSGIEQRATEYPEKQNLKMFDFANYYYPEVSYSFVENAGSAFASLCQFCLEQDVKLENVPALWFYQRRRLVARLNSPEMGNSIKSLTELYPNVVDLEMASLEKIEIRATSASSVGLQWRNNRQDWPTLKCLKITVNSIRTRSTILSADGYVEEHPEYTTSLFQFFFQDIVRVHLTELLLKFSGDDTNNAIPETPEIVASCPNLKKLTIINWPGRNQDLTALWDGLRHLEEVSLENCRDLEDYAFLGDDAKNPAFLKLPLKKLSLKSLDKMPRITDALFKVVLRNLNLTHLTLTSDAPIKSISIAGIRSLLTGNFAESIEKFPFKDWNLEGVTTEEFNKLEKQFRSYNLL